MKRTNVNLLCLISILHLSFHSHAETICLKNGMQMEGRIVAENDREVRLEISGGIIAIPKRSAGPKILIKSAYLGENPPPIRHVGAMA